MLKKFRLSIIIALLLSTSSFYSQTVTVYLTSTGGSYTSEKWMNITTGVNGNGTIIWEQGGGSIGTGAGLLTDEAITLNCGTTYYLNSFDKYDDSWDGTTYTLRDAAGGGGTLILNNGGVSPDDGSDTDATSTWLGSDYAADVESSESFSLTCPCVVPSIGTATAVTTNCASGKFDVQLTITSDGEGGSVTVSDGGTNPDQVVSTFPTTVTFSDYDAGNSITLNVDNGSCDVDANTVTENCSCATPPTATITTTNLNCVANTFDIQVSSINNGSGTSTDIYVDNVLDVAGSQLTGKTVGTSYTVTLKAVGSGAFTCETDYPGITRGCPTPCAGTVTAITDGYTASNITTPGTGGADDWVKHADAGGTADEGEFEDSDVKMYSYTTGAAAGESFYFTIEYDYSIDESHSIGVWTDCTNDSLTGSVTSYYNFDDVAGICAQGLAANTKYYIGVTNDYFSREDLDFDIIEFTVEKSATIPDDECAPAPGLNLLSPYTGSTRCSYTASAGSPGSCGTIQNDSWVKFTASETTVVIDYEVKNCSNGFGVQLSAFSGSCGSLSLIAGSCLNYASNNSSGTWTFNGLTIGNSYHIRADGYAGDLCSYVYRPIVGVLPVELLDFSGDALNNGYNRINWTTASEMNNDYFILEKSTDGINFEIINRQDGAGTSNSNNHYFNYDESPDKLTYYRLKQVDFNGEFTYSSIIAITNSNTSNKIKIYPNPSEDGIINIYSEDALEFEQINVLDAQGRIIYSSEPNNANSMQLDLSAYQSGLYTLLLIKKDSIITEKIILK